MVVRKSLTHRDLAAVGPRSIPSIQIAPGGFEPPFSESKSDVLPLDEGAIALKASPRESATQLRRRRRPILTREFLPVTPLRWLPSGPARARPDRQSPEPEAVPGGAPVVGQA